MKMAERIRRARRRADLSQAELARMLKVQRSAVSNWESASDIQPSMQNLSGIAKACAVSFEWLGTGRGRMRLDEDLEIPAGDAELVDLRDERELLAMYRNLPHRKRELMVQVMQVFLGSLAQGRAKD